MCGSVAPMSTTPITITVLRKADLRRGNYLQPWYECVGPDNTLFTNSSKAELKSVLTRKFGKVVLVIEDVR